MIVEYMNDDTYHCMYLNESRIKRVDFIQNEKRTILVIEIDTTIYIFSDSTLRLKSLTTDNDEIKNIYEIYKSI